MSDSFKVLVGKTIVSARIGGERRADEYVVIEATDKTYVFMSFGDCCADAYFAGATGTEALRGVVRSTGFSEGDQDYRDNDRTFVDHGFYTIATDLGRCTIELRTEHNGYYYGWVEYEESLDDAPGLRPLVDF